MRRITKFASIALLLSLGAWASKTTSRFGDAASAAAKPLEVNGTREVPVIDLSPPPKDS